MHILYKILLGNEWWLAKGLADSSVLVWSLFVDKMWVSSICDCDKHILSVCLRSCSCYICGVFLKSSQDSLYKRAQQTYVQTHKTMAMNWLF